MYAFTIKTDFRNVSGNLDGKTMQKRLKSPTLSLFSQKTDKKTLHLLKNDKRLSIFYWKTKCTNKFYMCMIKNAFENVSESSEEVVSLDLKAP